MPKSPHGKRYHEFRQILKDARLEAGLSQSEVAARLGEPQNFVSRYETGERRLDVVELIEVAEAIGFDPRSVIDRLMAAPKNG